MKRAAPDDATALIRTFLLADCMIDLHNAENYSKSFVDAGYTREFMNDLESPAEFDDICTSMSLAHRRRILKKLKTSKEEKSSKQPGACKMPAEKKQKSAITENENCKSDDFCVSDGDQKHSEMGKEEASISANIIAEVSLSGNICQFWREAGMCPDLEAQECNFEHPEEAKGIGQGTVQLGFNSKPQEASTGTCFQWGQSGSCVFGMQCKYKHEGEGNVPRCQRWMTKSCKFGDLCRFRHDQGLSSDEKNLQQEGTESLGRFKMWVGGLPQYMTDKNLENFFSSAVEDFGNVLEAKHMPDKQTGKKRGFGFVFFDTKKALDKAMNKEHLVFGKKLETRIAKENYHDSTVRNTMECYRCGLPGHLSYNCPNT